MKIAVQQVIKIIRPGIFCALQDIGRFGFRHLGVPSSGASDRQSLMYVNSLLHNLSNTPVLEIFGQGGRFEVMSDCVICFSGAEAMITVNGQKKDFSKPVTCRAGETIHIEKLIKGAILYFGISGGFYTSPIMDSVSFLKDTHLMALKSGDILYANIRNQSITGSGASLKPLEINKTKSILVYKGPEYDILSNASKSDIFEKSFQITSQSDRMGLRLIGTPLTKSSEKEMLTSAVTPGIVQLLPDGQLIILMRDCQTTGGYPRILIVDEHDINQLAQRSPGDKVQFSKIN